MQAEGLAGVLGWRLGSWGVGRSCTGFSSPGSGCRRRGIARLHCLESCGGSAASRVRAHWLPWSGWGPVRSGIRAPCFCQEPCRARSGSLTPRSRSEARDYLVSNFSRSQQVPTGAARPEGPGFGDPFPQSLPVLIASPTRVELPFPRRGAPILDPVTVTAAAQNNIGGGLTSGA